MSKVKRFYQNRAFALKCSSFGCEQVAKSYFACGIVLNEPKKASITNVKRLLKVKAKQDCCIPMCDKHLRLMNQYLSEITFK